MRNLGNLNVDGDVINLSIASGPSFPEAKQNEVFHLTQAFNSHLPGVYLYQGNDWKPMHTVNIGAEFPQQHDGQLFYKTGANEGLYVFNGTSWVSGTSATHNLTAGLQGGTEGEFFHLTNQEYTGTGTGPFVRQVMPKLDGLRLTPTSHLLIDNGTTQTYGWKDNTQPMSVRGNGANSPSFGVIFGNMQGYLWDPATMNQCWVDFHILHDYAAGTMMFPHVHWMPTTTNTGTVRWGIEYTVAKGHQQQAFSTSTVTVYLEYTIANANQRYLHIVTETPDALAIPATNLEIDGFIKTRVFRDAAHPNDTYPDNVHAWCVDLHYQAAQFSTINKAPNFFGTV